MTTRMPNGAHGAHAAVPSNAPGQPEEEKRQKKRLLIFWLLGAIAVAIVLLLLLLGRCTSDVYDDAIPMATDEEYQKRVNDAVAESMMNVSYLPNARLRSDGVHSTLFRVNNTPNNHHPIQFFIYDENGKQIYESVEIPVGYQVDKITFSSPLSRGTHDCTIEIGYVEAGNVTSSFPIRLEVS